MFQYLYEWAQNLAFYLVLITAVLHAVPDAGYKRYIRFFTGMVLILMIITPVFRIFGMDSQIVNFYQSREYEEKLREIEEAAGFLEDVDGLEVLEGVQEGMGGREASGKQKYMGEQEDVNEQEDIGERENVNEQEDIGEREDRKMRKNAGKQGSIIVEEIRVEGNEAD